MSSNFPLPISLDGCELFAEATATQLRPATRSDHEFVITTYLDGIAELGDAAREIWPDPVELADHVLRNGLRRTYILEQERQAVGFITVAFVSWPAEIDSLFIASSHRNRGLGTAAVRAVLAQAWRAQLPVDVWVYNTNARARFFWKRLGFVELNSQDDFTRFRRLLTRQNNLVDA